VVRGSAAVSISPGASQGRVETDVGKEQGGSGAFCGGSKRIAR
jgi:hypothetical protein